MTSSSDTCPSLTLDVEDGLERLMGDRALYLQILERFRLDYQAAPRRLRQQLHDGEAEAARRLCHTLKGAAGMIGARAVRELAAELEQALLRPDAAPAQQQLDQLELALRSVLGMVDSLLCDGAARPTTPLELPPAAQPAAHLLRQRLAQLLRDGDGAAIDVLEQSAGVLASSLGLALFQRVAAAAHEFDFEAALEELAAGD